LSDFRWIFVIACAVSLGKKRAGTRQGKLCWRGPLILTTCAGILTRNVEAVSQAQPFLFSSENLRATGRTLSHGSTSAG
jgi:hypothetical protein